MYACLSYDGCPACEPINYVEEIDKQNGDAPKWREMPSHTIINVLVIYTDVYHITYIYHLCTDAITSGANILCSNSYGKAHFMFISMCAFHIVQ